MTWDWNRMTTPKSRVKKECAEFLLLYETSLEMAKELYEVHTKREVLMAEHNELRSYFK